MPQLNERIPAPSDDRSRWLQARAARVTSQNGEDGIIQAIFERIGVKSRWCVEFGAWDGRHLSNTWSLINQSGWSSVQIEGDERKARQLSQRYMHREDVFTLNELIALEGENTLDRLLARTSIPTDPDLMVIDVDSIEWQIWESLIDHRPRVVVVEFNPSMPNDLLYVQDPDPTLREGCSPAALVQLAKRKGYELVCIQDPNAFFVLAEDFLALDIPDNRLETLRPQSGFVSNVVQFPDGRVALLGSPHQIWSTAKLSISAEQQ